MKKAFCITMVVAFAFSLLAACGANPGTNNSEAPNNQSNSESGQDASGNDENIGVDDPEKDYNIYFIADYYENDGSFSVLGLDLPVSQENGETSLEVQKGDVIVVESIEYRVAVESIELNFYTQPSFEDVISWWSSYMDSCIENGVVEGGV